jgi:hypothetical protein
MGAKKGHDMNEAPTHDPDQPVSGASAAPPPSYEERLKLYGLSQNKVKAADLTVGGGECINLSLRDEEASRYSKIAQRIPAPTVSDLKRLIGTPDATVQAQCRCPEGLTQTVSPTFEKLTDLSASQREVLRAASEEYIHGNSQLVESYVPAINKALSLSGKARVTLLPFFDIVVERDAVLTIDATVDVILANKVIIKLGGRIRLIGRVKIDCTSIQGEESFVSVFSGPVLL